MIVYKEISTNLLLAMGDAFSFIIVAGLILLVGYGHKREQIYRKIEIEKKQAFGDVAVVREVYQAKMKGIENKYKTELDKLERHRQEVLDFLPFFKK